MRIAPHISAAAVVVLAAAACTDGTVNPALAEILAPSANDSVACIPWSAGGVTPPDGGCRRLRVRPIGGPIPRVFNDRNEAHLAVARAAGIRPVEAGTDAWAHSAGLVRVRPCSLYYIDRLTHSYPFLTRDAADLLNEIGSRFRDSLAARGGGAYRPKVTSLLRTHQSVGQLRRVNRNASAESAHCYGTTFDISYSKFVCDDSTATARTFEDLKNLLAEVVADLRRQGRCLVKHERRQACFHITSIPQPSEPQPEDED